MGFSTWMTYFVCLCTAFLTACAGRSDNHDSYTAVVDAGSSGSRLFLYKSAPSGSFVNIQTMLEEQPGSVKGLSSFVNTPAQAGPEEIQPLLNILSAYLTEHGIPKNQVPVYALATAGMRMLEQTNPTAVTRIYQSVSTTLSNSGYMAKQVGTILGQNEGLYAWVDANYLKGNFQNNTATSGIVEVGGASTQIAFGTSLTSNPNVVNKTINGVTYSVFSVSYLGLGQNEARNLMITSTSPNSGGISNNVCYPFNPGPYDDTTSPATYSLKNNGNNISSSGSNFNYNACAGVYQSVINSVGSNVYNRVQANNTTPADISGIDYFFTTNFIGLSSVAYALNDLGASGAANQQAALQTSITTKCTVSGSNPDPWATIYAAYGNVNSTYAQGSCANSTYNNQLVFGALGIPPGNLSAVETLDGNKLSWTRGFVVLLNSP